MVLHIIPLFLHVDIQHNQCLCRFFKSREFKFCRRTLAEIESAC